MKLPLHKNSLHVNIVREATELLQYLNMQKIVWCLMLNILLKNTYRKSVKIKQKEIPMDIRLKILLIGSMLIVIYALIPKRAPKQRDVVVWTDQFAIMNFPEGTNRPVDIGFVYPGSNVIWRFHK